MFDGGSVPEVLWVRIIGRENDLFSVVRWDNGTWSLELRPPYPIKPEVKIDFGRLGTVLISLKLENQTGIIYPDTTAVLILQNILRWP